MRKFKTFVALTMVTAAVALTGCSKAPSYKDGSYTGSSDAGMHPGLKVEVTVKDSKIADVNVVAHEETEGIGTNAVDQLPATIVEKNSTEVDAVSGATLSSNAIKEAVNNALAEAK